MAVYRSSNQIFGSWPIVPDIGLGIPGDRPIPGTIYSRATMLGVVKEPSGGYPVGGKSFNLVVDLNIYAIVFSAGNKTLQEVIDTINAATLAGSPSITRDVAYNDNGFLRLESPEEDALAPSSLEVNHITDYDVLFDLGLFAGIQHLGGEFRQAWHWDPDRQVAAPQQLAIVDGESFSASAINRSIAQLAQNTDFHEGLLGKKRVAKPAEIAPFVFTAAGVDTGYQFASNETVLVDPSTALDKLFTVLDADYMPLTVENESVVYTASGTATVAWDATARVMTVTETGGFSLTDDTVDRYVKLSNLADEGQGENTLNGELLKISHVIDVNTAQVLPIIPGTGAVPEDPSDWTQVSRSFEKIQVTTDPVVVSAIKDTNNGTDVQLGPVARTGSGFGTPRAPTRVELGDRIVIDDAAVDFTVDTVVGDQLVWTGHARGSFPFDNSRTFRIAAVIDEKTVQVVEDAWGPTLLNPDLSTPGTIVVQTDGKFWKTPFIEFSPQVPPDGTTIAIAYNALSTIKDATDDPLFLGAGSFGTKYAGVADTKVQEAVLAILGPSAEDLSTYLHSDRRNSLEDIYYRVKQEHHEHSTADGQAGKHSDIRPDTIDMFPDVAGDTVIIRGATGETSTVKLRVLDDSDNTRFFIMADGTVRFLDANETANHKIEVNPNNHTLEILTDETTGGDVKATLSTRDSTSQAILELLSSATSGTPGGQLRMGARQAPTANPLTYLWEVEDAVGLSLNVEADGAGGGPFNDVLTILANGGVVVNGGSGSTEALKVAPTKTTGIGLTVTGGSTSGAALVASVLAGSAAAVTGNTTAGTGPGVSGTAASGPGVKGIATTGLGGEFEGGGTSAGVLGKGPSANPYVGGIETGTENQSAGLVGLGGSGGTRIGVVGQGAAVGSGVFGLSGETNGAHGVRGDGVTRPGITGHGVRGDGKGTSGTGGWFQNLTGLGLYVQPDNSGTPARGAAWFAPQDLTPSAPAAGGGEIFMRDIGTTAKLKYDNGDEWERVRSYTYVSETLDSETGTAAQPYFSHADSAYTFPAGTLEVGTVLRVRAGGEITADGSGGLWSFIVQISPTVGTPNFGLVSTPSSATPAANWHFFLDVEVVIIAVGNPVTALLTGIASIGPSGGAGILHETQSYNGVLNNINPAAANSIYVNFAPGSSASNTAELKFFAVEITAPRT
jgi:hypothetical protein